VKQSTIARPVECAGAGLHSGLPTRVRLEPGSANSGIIFVPRQLPSSELCANAKQPLCEVEIPARITSVHSSSRATTLALAESTSRESEGHEAIRVATVEHLLASLYAHQIDNVRVVVDGTEIPALDGSAAPLFDLIESAGRTFLDAECTVFALKESIEVREGDRWIRAEPSERLGVSYAIDFDHALIGRQSLEIPILDATRFRSELARARTFGFEGEIAALRRSGLGLGGSLDNTVVLGASGILNSGGLRYADEFVRHKLIDLVGDLALLGTRLQAYVHVERGGHALHHQLVRALADAILQDDLSRQDETKSGSTPEQRSGSDAYPT
jgi:UDP-3-O-[3-hydroxymyristoyl] N-acetylglucosamine deacetylase